MNPFDLDRERIAGYVARHGSPLYLVSRERLRENFRRLDEGLPAAKLFYAVKANPHPLILETLHEAGAGFDVASKGEIQAAVGAGANPRDDLIFADTVKDPRHIRYAWDIGLDDFTYDNASELTQIARHAPGAFVTLRLAVSNEGAVAHLSEKFGAPDDEAVPLLTASRDAGLVPRGLSFHVGSQCLDDRRWVEALETCARVRDRARAAGIELTMLDIGGGFPARYFREDVDIARTCGVVSEAFARLFGAGTELVAEPGRAIVADAVALVTRVISASHRAGRDWLYFDDGVYGSFLEVLLYHARYPLRAETDGPSRPYVLAGPTCDSIDVFSRDAQGRVATEDLAAMDLDDVLVAGGMGAYTFSESTRFNGFEPPAFVAVD